MSYPTPTVAGDQLPADDLNDFVLNPTYTYGETIAVGEALYLAAADSKVYKLDADTLAHVSAFVGFAAEAGNLNDTKYVLGPGKVVTGLSGLTAGSIYYLSATAGGVSTTPGSYVRPIGLAISTTRLLVLPEPIPQKGDVGNGADGAVNFDGSTDYASFSSRSGGVYTLSRDLYATIITITGTGTIIDTNGYRVFAKYGVFRASGNGKFRNNGSDGGDGTDAGALGTSAGVGGTAPSGPGANTVPGPSAPKDGGDGKRIVSSTTTAGDPGDNGDSITNSIVESAASLTAGAGGSAVSPTGTGAGGAPGSAATTTVSKAQPRASGPAVMLGFTNSTGFVGLRCAASGPGGGGGGVSSDIADDVASGGGGSSAASAGMIWLAALVIVDLGTGTMFEANGGIGGDGGDATRNAATGNRGGGGGGAGPGGHGGVIMRLFYLMVGACTATVTGGSKGTPGTGIATGTGTGNNGSAAADGSSGIVIDIRL